MRPKVDHSKGTPTHLCVQRELRSIFGRKKKNLLNYQVESCRIVREDYRLFFEGCYPLPLQYLHGDDSVLILYCLWPELASQCILTNTLFLCMHKYLLFSEVRRLPPGDPNTVIGEQPEHRYAG